MPIYTKTGDRGKTSLRTGSRIWKDSIRVEAYGSIDELNSYIGVVISTLGEPKRGWKKYLQTQLLSIQGDLLFIGSSLAKSEVMLDRLDPNTKKFEEQIDTMTEKLPELSNFILPGGNPVGSHLQYARTLVRRAERRVVTLAKTEKVDDSLIRYINRLSDLFFTMSRFANFKEKKSEVVWAPFK